MKLTKSAQNMAEVRIRTDEVSNHTYGKATKSVTYIRQGEADVV
ncbi:hypothetical protein [Streptococcus pneumoniae]|nr:hypothetical protein [Streptococcus pneumoniae]